MTRDVSMYHNAVLICISLMTSILPVLILAGGTGKKIVDKKKERLREGFEKK